MTASEIMNAEAFLSAVMTKRTEGGLRLEFIVPDSAEPFVCYPRDDAQKAKWLANAKRDGWVLK